MATLKFYDDFTGSSLALWISPQTGGTWHAPDTWEESGSAVNATWWIDPLYSATNQADANPFSVSNSILNIGLLKTPADVPASAVGNQPYISGKIVTNGRFQTTYGYFEARIKMPKGNGFMGAFWLNPHNGAGWPPEIDIVEMVSSAPTVTTFAVWSNDYGSPPTNHGGYFDTRTVDLTADYHYYAVNWQNDFITWYLDGQQLFQQPTPSDCHQDFYVLLDAVVGRSTDWGGAPDSTTPFPGQMQVDYVAVWDVSPYPGGGGGTGAGLNLNPGGGGGGGTTTTPGAWMDHFAFGGNEFFLPFVNEQEYMCDIGVGNTSSTGYNPFSVANSILTITAKTVAASGISNPANQPWNSGCLTSCLEINGEPKPGLYAANTGYFEIRCKVPSGGTAGTPGFWPAFVLYPLQAADGSNPPGEIDIFEILGGSTGTVRQSIHSSVAGAGHEYDYTGAGDTSQAFHTYGCQVNATNITFYVDGVQTAQQATPSDLLNNVWYINCPFSVAGSSSWQGAPNVSVSTTTGTLQIDYIGAWANYAAAYPSGGTVPTKSAALFLDDFNALNISFSGAAPKTFVSFDGAVVFIGDGASITDANNHVWSINASGRVTIDGTADGTTANAKELAYVGGSVWQYFTGYPYATPGSGSITDAAGHVWTISAAPADWVLEDGVQTNGGGGTAAIELYNGTIYAQDGGGTGWYTYNGSTWNPAGLTPPDHNTNAWLKKTLPTDAWASVSNPLAVPTYTSKDKSTVSFGSTSKLIDASGNAYGISSAGQVVANGTADTSLPGVTEIAYVTSSIWRFQSSSGLWWFETSPAGPWQPTGGTSVSPLPSATTKRAPADQPFSSTSVWNIGIGSGATWGAATDTDVKQLVGLTGNMLAATNGQPIFLGVPSDPLVQITCTDTTFTVPTQSVHVPLGSVPSSPTDGWMNFFDLTQPTKMWSYAGCRLNNGVDVTGGITATKGAVWDCSGDGVANAINPGTDYNFLAGTITDYDLQNGAIQHALRFSLGLDVLKSPGSTWTASIPWPGTHEDLNGPTTYKGNVTYGCTIGIPSSVTLPSLSRGGSWLATALQKYGAICRIGSAANGSINFYTTPENEQNQNIVQMRSDLPKIIPLLNIMRNQSPSSVNGGGSYPPTLPAVDTNPVYYQPMYRPTGTQTWINFGRPIKETNVVVTGLQSGIKHDFEVVAYNARGSLTSSVVSDSTTGAGSITAINLSNNSVTVGSPAGTVVGIISVSMSSGSFSGSLSISGTDASSFSLSGSQIVTTVVAAQRNYSITLTATQGGVAPFSQAETIVGQSTLPGAPTNVISPSQSSTQVVLSWSPPTIGAKLDAGAYQVQYKTTQSGVFLNGPSVPYCTPGSGSFTDSFGNVWSLNTGNNPVVNGNVDTVSHATMLLLVGGVVWQIDLSSNWYSIQPTGTITSPPANWSGPTTTSPLTDVVVSGLSASTAYNFQVYVSNTAGSGPPAATTPSSISTQAASSVGPPASSPFLTADLTSAMQWPVSGGGQQNVVQQLWGISSSTLTNASNITTGTPFYAWADSNATSALGTVNPGLVYLKDGGVTFWDSNQNVIPSVMANLVNNFYKIDPLGIAKVIFGVDFTLNVGNPLSSSGFVTAAQYATAMKNLATYLLGYTMPNGKKFPLAGMMGHDEPDGIDGGSFGEANTATYYNQFGPAVKAVNSNLVIIGPNLSFMNPWLDFGSRVSSLDIYSWDTFTGTNTTNAFDTTCYTTDQPTRFTGDANTGSTSLTVKPKGMMVGGFGVTGDTSAACMNSYVGAVYCARSCLQSLNNANVPMWMGVWGGYGNGTYGVVTNPAEASAGWYGVTNTTQVTPKGYMMAQAVRKIYGQRWNTPTNSGGLLVCAVTRADGSIGLIIVNPGLGSKSGQVALSHAPVGGSSPLNPNGTGQLNVWQMTSAQTVPGQDGAYSTVQVTNGLTSIMSFPDPSVTIIST